MFKKENNKSKNVDDYYFTFQFFEPIDYEVYLYNSRNIRNQHLKGSWMLFLKILSVQNVHWRILLLNTDYLRLKLIKGLKRLSRYFLKSLFSIEETFYFYSVILLWKLAVTRYHIILEFFECYIKHIVICIIPAWEPENPPEQHFLHQYGTEHNTAILYARLIWIMFMNHIIKVIKMA